MVQNVEPRRRLPGPGTFALALLLASCVEPSEDVPTNQPGFPLPGLTADQLARFEEGRAWFDYGWSPDEGLGPLYLQDRCSSCHDLPTLGGTGVEVLPLVSRSLGLEDCDPLEGLGGPVIQDRATPPLQAAGIQRERTPELATERVRFLAPLLYGAGLVEAIPEAEILSRADPGDLDGDGISGRPARASDGQIGRYTRKGSAADLLHQAASAASTDLGLTSSIHPRESTVNGEPLPAGVDPVAEPELRQEVLDRIVDYLSYLAPLSKESPETPAAADSIRRGEGLFEDIGCTSCHTPSMVTGENEVEALSQKTIYLYSDLLLHDLGPDFGTVCSGDVAATESITARLQGLGLRYTFVQDVMGLPGVEETILRHGGEAKASRDAFAALGFTERALLLRFLASI